ncbi:MAG: hypothetical protein KC620_17750 [Myxococcales bacterium]|nr:hypothetical protein [Myxococcales bacterium]
MKPLVFALFALSLGCAGRAHLDDDAGQATRRLFAAQAQGRTTRSPTALDAATVRRIMNDYTRSTPAPPTPALPPTLP